jgi:hypothetical protein
MKILDLILIVAISAILAASCNKQKQVVTTQHEAKFTNYRLNGEGGTIAITPNWQAKKQKWIFAGGVGVTSSFDLWLGQDYTYLDCKGEGIVKYDLSGNFVGLATNTDMCADVANNNGTVEHYIPIGELTVNFDINDPTIFYVERTRGSKGIVN